MFSMYSFNRPNNLLKISLRHFSLGHPRNVPMKPFLKLSNKSAGFRVRGVETGFFAFLRLLLTALPVLVSALVATTAFGAGSGGCELPICISLDGSSFMSFESFGLLANNSLVVPTMPLAADDGNILRSFEAANGSCTGSPRLTTFSSVDGRDDGASALDGRDNGAAGASDNNGAILADNGPCAADAMLVNAKRVTGAADFVEQLACCTGFVDVTQLALL